MRPPSDAEFSEFVHANWPALYRTAYLLLGDHAEAEDLVQTALAKTYGSWGKVRDLQAAPAFARTTMVNTVYDVAAGTHVTLPGRAFDAGWAGDGSLFTVKGDRLTRCSPRTGACTWSRFDGSSEDRDTRLAGQTYES